MGERERLRRANPERTGPIRDWSKLYQTPSPQDSANRPPNSLVNGFGRQSEETSEAALRGVELGYRIVDKHIREGHSAAQCHQRDTAASQTEERGGITQTDADKVIDRTFRAISDLLPLWRDLFNSVVTSGLLRIPSPGPNSGYSPGNAPAEAGVVDIELASPRPARVTLALQPGHDCRRLVVRGLHAIDPQKASVTNVEFSPAVAGQRACMRIRVSADHPSGVYTGVVVDKDSEQPCGTLTVRISD